MKAIKSNYAEVFNMLSNEQKREIFENFLVFMIDSELISSGDNILNELFFDYFERHKDEDNLENLVSIAKFIRSFNELVVIVQDTYILSLKTKSNELNKQLESSRQETQMQLVN
jgi:hypothetical protein